MTKLTIIKCTVHKVDVELTDAELSGLSASKNPADVVAHYATEDNITDTGHMLVGME